MMEHTATRATGRRCAWGLAATLALVSTGANAVPMLFFGEDLATGGAVPAGGNAETARGMFLSNLSGGVGTETFESFASTDLPPYAISFPGSTGNITASLSNAAGICDANVNCTGSAAGEFATSGDRWIFTDESLTATFSDPIAAFGFYGTDIGDLGAQLTISLTATGGAVTVFNVPHTLSSSNSDGDLLFWGFVDAADTYTSVQFGLSGGTGDFFGFDDLTVGDAMQVTTVPEPATLGLVFAGIAGIAARKRGLRS